MPHTTIYRNIHQHSMLYFWLVFPFMLIVHDTYFYWTHRLMHHPKLFTFFHVVHHKSVNPSPWASFSFQPTEAIIESAIIYIFAFAFPIHILHLFIFLIFMTIYNVYGHLGFELFPKWFNKHWFFKWFNTSVNHNMHHQYFKGNYSLYFTWWDRIMKTLHKDYDTRFEEFCNETIILRKEIKYAEKSEVQYCDARAEHQLKKSILIENVDLFSIMSSNYFFHEHYTIMRNFLFF